MKWSLNFQLGVMVGEYIVLTSLPTLSTDMLKTRNVVEVDKELSDEWEVRNKRWLDVAWDKDVEKEESNKIFYSNLDWYKKNIEAKYLEDEIRILVPNVKPTNEKLFLKGVDHALWDCDCSHYGDPRLEDKPYLDIAVRRYIILTKSKYEPYEGAEAN